MVLTYFLIAFEMVLVAPAITGITPVFTFHIRCISIVKSFQNLLRFFLNHIPVSWNCDIYQHTCTLFIIAYYSVWLVIGDGPVSLYFLVPLLLWLLLLFLPSFRWSTSHA
jgi:hypothetical protein